LHYVDYAVYLERLTCIDLFLDTTIYNAGTTASDALWKGVPVITCIGKSFSARIAASVLVAAELEHLITQTLDEYVLLGIELATNTVRYQEVKNQLLVNLKNSKLFYSAESTRTLEKAYQLVWQTYFNQQPYSDIVV